MNFILQAVRLLHVALGIANQNTRRQLHAAALLLQREVRRVQPVDSLSRPIEHLLRRELPWCRRTGARQQQHESKPRPRHRRQLTPVHV
jgi:hypothetical protein